MRIFTRFHYNPLGVYYFITGNKIKTFLLLTQFIRCVENDKILIDYFSVSYY